MPRVPSYQPNQVPPAEITNSRFHAANNNGGAFGGLAEGLSDLGRTMGNVAEAQDRLNAENDDTQSRLLAAEANRQYATATSEFGELQAGAAREAQGTYAERLNKIRDETLQRAGSPRQKRLLEERLIGLHDASATQIATHAVRQQKVERNAAFGSQISSFAESAAAADDPHVRDQLIASAIAVRHDQMRDIDGLREDVAPEAFKVEGLKIASQIHGAVMDRMFAVPDPNIEEVAGYLEAYGDEMTESLRSATLKRLQDPLQGRMARSDADVVMGLVQPSERAPAAPAGAPAANLDAITAQAESGGREFRADGSRVTSPVGARGMMQVMPATARDPGFGIRPSDGSPEQDARVGREYRATMEKRYGGDLAKMWAAYNAGPGRVDDLVKQYGENWLSHAPAETRAYVMKNVAAVGGATSAYANAPREWDSAAVYDNLDKVAEREGWTPERTERVRGELDRRIKRDEGLLQEKRSDAEDKASDIAASNPTAFRVSMIPRDVWNAMTPTQQAKFRKVEEDLTKPKEPKANGAYSLTLSVMQRLEPDRFKREDILAHANELTPSEITSFFISQQEAIRKPPAAFQPQSAIQEAINRGAKYQGVKLDDKDLPRVYDTMEAVLRTRFGKNGTINANDADEAFRTAVATTRTEEHGLLDRFLGPRAGSKPAYEVTAQDIPEAWRSRFERNWRGGGRPTPAQILDAYRRSMHLAQ